MNRHGQNIYRASVFIGVHQNTPMSLYKPRAYIRDFTASGNWKSSHEISNQTLYMLVEGKLVGMSKMDSLVQDGWLVKSVEILDVRTSWVIPKCKE